MMDTHINQEPQEPDEPDPRVQDAVEIPVESVEIIPEDDALVKDKTDPDYNV